MQPSRLLAGSGTATPRSDGGALPRAGSGNSELGSKEGSFSSSGPRLSRPSSREQILDELSGKTNASGKPQTEALRDSFQAVRTARGQASTSVQFNVSASTNLGEQVVSRRAPRGRRGARAWLRGAWVQP